MFPPPDAKSSSITDLLERIMIHKICRDKHSPLVWALKHLSTGVFTSALVAATHGVATANVSHVSCPNVSVTSLADSIAFYTDVLEFKLIRIDDSSSVARLTPGIAPSTQSQTAHLSIGAECIDLTAYKNPGGVPFPVDSRGNDLWFQHIAIVVSDMDKAYARIRKSRVHFVSNIPQILPAWNKEAASIGAFYFHDPDGHYLELIHFPPGKGQPKWHGDSSKLFMGIDHTAIVVSDTLRSLGFYRDKLHFRVVGTSENYGTEQEHLSGVFNAHVLITSLRSTSGIGIELLDYLSPLSGRPIPSHLHANDIACWQTRLEVTGVNDADHWITLPSHSSDYRAAAWTSDPDGHVLELVRR
jgi:catechol 2,3-dioxygenase-like lactoylglutathione lyase family enzyme